MAASIRQASPEDAPELTGLVGQYWAFEAIEGYDRRRMETQLRGFLAMPDRAVCWVADNGGRLVGYLLAVFVLSLQHGGMMAEMDEFFVIPAARGCGVGKALLEHAEHALNRLGMIRLQLQLGVKNHYARCFYLKRGFAPRAGFELWDKPLPPAR